MDKMIMWIITLFGFLLSGLLDITAFSINSEINANKQLYGSRKYGASCFVGNTTYVHGETFKLDCRTQCVCQNGRHACSTLCPHENLPPPIHTEICFSPKLVQLPDHCCRVWLCETPKTDVNATCFNASTSAWTLCSENCGIGLSSRNVSTTPGCQQLSNVRLCQNHKCNNNHNMIAQSNQNLIPASSKDLSQHSSYLEKQHRIRKGHECRSSQRIGSARLRLGPCVSSKLYRPKVCGQCQSRKMCCVPSVSSTIQIELLCPLNSGNLFDYLEYGHDLWDSTSTEPLDQEMLQSRRIGIENKFIDVEWVLKCQCGYKGDQCAQSAASTQPDSTTFRFSELLKRVHRT